MLILANLTNTSLDAPKILSKTGVSINFCKSKLPPKSFLNDTVNDVVVIFLTLPFGNVTFILFAFDVVKGISITLSESLSLT